MSADDISDAEHGEQVRARLAAATPGPWQWFGNTATRTIYLATVDRGRQFVMSFFRWGMQGATPAFRGDGWMDPAAAFARYEVAPDATTPNDPRLYRHDFQGLRHPDADLIAHAPDDLARLLARAEAAEDRLAVAWQEGRDSLLHDFLRPTGLDGFRPSTPNPYAKPQENGA